VVRQVHPRPAGPCDWRNSAVALGGQRPFERPLYAIIQYMAEHSGYAVVADQSDIPQPGRLEKSIADAVMRAHAGSPQRLEAPANVVQEVDRILRGTEQHFPYIRHRVEPVAPGMLRLVLWVEHAEFDGSVDRIADKRPSPSDTALMDVLTSESTVVGSAAQVVTKARKRMQARRQRILACDYCGARPLTLDTQGLYRVIGGALDRERVLCWKHAGQEQAAGARLRPV
jgi:hypothetical protein